MRFLKIIPLFLILIISSWSFGQEQQTNLTKIEITISGMACQEGCADTINENIKNLKGVENSEVSYANGLAKITYDPSIVSIDSLKNTITTTKVKNYTYAIENVTKLD